MEALFKTKVAAYIFLEVPVIFTPSKAAATASTFVIACARRLSLYIAVIAAGVSERPDQRLL